MKTTKKKNIQKQKKSLKKGGNNISEELLNESIQPFIIKIQDNLESLYNNDFLDKDNVKIINNISKNINIIVTKLNKFVDLYPVYYQNIRNNIVFFLNDLIQNIMNNRFGQNFIDRSIYALEDDIIDKNVTNADNDRIEEIRKKLKITKKNLDYFVKLANITIKIVDDNDFDSHIYYELDTFCYYNQKFLLDNSLILDEFVDSREIYSLERVWQLWDFTS
jgi:hypothetical protein